MTDLLTLFDIDNPPLPIRRRPALIVTPALVARFMSQVHVDYGMPDGCWIWTGTKNKQGYGHFKVKNKMQKFQINFSHRVAYQIFNGCIYDNLIVCHTCDNPFCVNPIHLFLGTHKDNALDMISKGRHNEARKTHCPQGHEYNTENTYILPNTNNRSCITCKKLNYLKRKTK